MFLLLLIGFVWLCVKFAGGLWSGKTASESIKATEPKDPEKTLVTILRVLFMYIPLALLIGFNLLTLFANTRYFILVFAVSCIIAAPWMWFFNWFLKK